MGFLYHNLANPGLGHCKMNLENFWRPFANLQLKTKEKNYFGFYKVDFLIRWKKEKSRNSFIFGEKVYLIALLLTKN